MPTLDDVRRIALGLPEMYEKPSGQRGTATWRVKQDYIVWERTPGKTDLKQLAELGRRWPDGPVAAVLVDGIAFKEALLSGYPDVFFTIPHFNTLDAVLFHLDLIELDHLEELIIDAWLLKAPRLVAKQWLAEHRPHDNQR